MRDKLDRYYTPDSLAFACVKAVLADHQQPMRRAWEPSSGGGAFVRALLEYAGTIALGTCDIDPDAPVHPGVTGHVAGDFLGIDRDRMEAVARGPISWVVGNPPYRDAEDHVRHALEVSDRHVVFLLRLGFLGSRGRCLGLWRESPLRKVWVIGPRPSFTGDGKTDGSEYGLFWWDKLHQGPPELGWIAQQERW